MSLATLVQTASAKSNFSQIEDYIRFCKQYLAFLEHGIQATIVSQNEVNYRFFQYKEDGYYNITRPINADLMFSTDDAAKLDKFTRIFRSVRDIPSSDTESRLLIMRSIYTIQQSIGATLDALPASSSNKARKINGDLFERFIQLLIQSIGVACTTGIVQVPVYLDSKFQFNMRYQHDLLVYSNEELKVIGSVKTSSKDRIDKIFMDKFLYSQLTETNLPHIAIFLHDVQRKKTKTEQEYGINSTFLAGHFKTFTIKLDALDGVYYCDIRPNMWQDDLLRQHIRTIDYFFCEDIWRFLQSEGLSLGELKIQPESQP